MTGRGWWELTRRETDVLQLAAQGVTLAETGRRLFIEADTVKEHRSRLLEKLGASNITHAVALAYQQGLIAIPDDRPFRVLVIDGVEYVPKAAA